MKNLGFENVQLVPRYSSLPSRAAANTSVKLFKEFKLPVVPANMLTVINAKIAKQLSESGHFYIFHRFGTDKDQTQPATLTFIRNAQDWHTISISTGVNDDTIETLKTVKSEGLRVDSICIDVAHAHHVKTRERIEWLREHLPNTYIIAGNLATAEAAEDLVKWGADALKCGIGTGSICTTRLQTGFSIPAFSCVQRVSAISKHLISHRGNKVPLIADGGIRNIGDIAKAIVGGADMAMSGNLFATCIDSPAEIKDGKKAYFGSTSFQAKKSNTHIEGRLLEIEAGGTFESRLEEIKQALQSSISYSGGSDLSGLRDVEWIEI